MRSFSSASLAFDFGLCGLFGCQPGGFFRRLALGAFDRLARQPLLSQLFLLDFALLARLENGLAFGLAGKHRRVVLCGPSLEPFEQSLLRFVRRVTALEDVLFPIHRQISVPEVSQRRLHTHGRREFKRHSRITPMKNIMGQRANPCRRGGLSSTARFWNQFVS